MPTFSPRRLPQSRAERLIASGRLILAAASLGAIYFDPLEPSRYPAFTYSLLVAYNVYALAMAYWTATATTTTRSLMLTTHVLDVVFFGTINVLTFGPTGPFFIFFVFSMLCAMLRFGRRGTILTAAFAVVVFIATSGTRLDTADFELNRFIIRLTYLFVVASMLVHFAGYQERIQRDLERIARWPRSSRGDLESLISELMTTAASIFSATRVILAHQHLSAREVYLGAVGPNGELEAEKQSDDTAALFFTRDSGTFFAAGAAEAGADLEDERVLATAGPGRRRRLDPDLERRFAIERVVATSFQGEFVRGQLLLLDGAPPLLEEVNLARIAGSVIAGRLDHFYAARQLERGAVAEERVRVARDLHDSVLQSLTGVALQLRTLPRLMMRDRSTAEARLVEVEQVITGAQRELRSFIDELRPERSRQEDVLGERLASLAQRYAEQWGLRVASDVAPLVHLIPLRARHEVFAIVNEAVANAARHAGASRVTVTIDVADGMVHMAIADDGRGFPFRGRYELATMVRERIGPESLKERVSALGGSMVLDSSPGGARLEIEMPLAAEQG